MHLIKIVTLVALMAVGGLTLATRAEALPLQGAPAIGTAANQGDIRQDVRYVCRRVWRCGRFSCGWRRACYWTPGPYAYAYPYAYRPYAYSYRPYWRPHRHWRPHRRW
jgi:hypothetical protein